MLVATTRGWTHGGQYKKRYSLLRMDQTIVICWVECRLVYNQKLPLCNQGLQLISPLLTHKLAFVCIGAGLRLPTTRVPGVFVTMACSVGVLGVFECQDWRIFAQQLPVPGVSRSIAGISLLGGVTSTSKMEGIFLPTASTQSI